MNRWVVAGFIAALLVGCSGPATEPRGAERPRAEKPQADRQTTEAAPASAPARPRRPIDPRRGGLEIGLGEWAVTPEAPAIRPGRVTFVIHNRGTMGHGFEIELERVGGSSGSGSGDLFKAEGELLQPGESTRMTVTLSPGAYKIECLVDGHDDMGMEGILEVRPDAPLVKPQRPDGADRVAIKDFAFDPDVTNVEVGTEVKWNNDDPAEHTVTSLDGRFDSGVLDPGASFTFVFDKPGTYSYRCDIHPSMKGTIKVAA